MSHNVRTFASLSDGDMGVLEPRRVERLKVKGNREWSRRELLAPFLFM